MKCLRHLSIYQGDLLIHLKLVCIKNQNIRKNKSKFERSFDGDNGQFTGQQCRKVWLQRESSQRDLKIRSNYRNFRIVEICSNHEDFWITEIRIRESQMYLFLRVISQCGNTLKRNTRCSYTFVYKIFRHAGKNSKANCELISKIDFQGIVCCFKTSFEKYNMLSNLGTKSQCLWKLMVDGSMEFEKFYRI